MVDHEHALVAVCKSNGKIKLNQMVDMTAGGAVSGGFWGLLIGLIFLNPLVGIAVGAGAGAVGGALSDVGINDKFMKSLAKRLVPGTSALFILTQSDFTDKVLEKLQGTGGKILQTSLSHEDEDRLQRVLSSVEE